MPRLMLTTAGLRGLQLSNRLPNDRRRRGEAAAIANTNAVHRTNGADPKEKPPKCRPQQCGPCSRRHRCYYTTHISVGGRSTFEFAVAALIPVSRMYALCAGAIFDVREVIGITNAGALIESASGSKLVVDCVLLKVASASSSTYSTLGRGECDRSSFRKFN